MIPKRAIELSIEGGWKTDLEALRRNPSADYYWQKIALDPTFWQSLGVSLKWGSKVYIPTAEDFFALIMRGKDTAEFWEELLN